MNDIGDALHVWEEAPGSPGGGGRRPGGGQEDSGVIVVYIFIPFQWRENTMGYNQCIVQSLSHPKYLCGSIYVVLRIAF